MSNNPEPSHVSQDGQGVQPSPGTIRVAVVDDDLLSRTALSTILAHFPDIKLAWTAESGTAALALLDSRDKAGGGVDVALVDVQMPGISGIETCQELKRRNPQMAVVILTTFTPEQYLGDALAAGAIGFLVKDEAPERIAGAVRAASQSIGVFSPSATNHLQHPSTSSGAGVSNPLTDKEAQVAVLVAESLTNQQIARRLAMSESTVKSHISASIVKLDCVDRVGIALWAHRAGLVP